MKHYLSRNYTIDHLDFDDLESCVSIYEDQIRGWFFEQARLVDQASIHGGLVILLVVLSYVEARAIFYKGEDSEGRSKPFFRFGFKEIFPISGADSAERDKIIDELYKELRCGLFQTGITRGKVRVSNAYRYYLNIFVDQQGNCLVIEVNPELMLDQAESHLAGYVTRLRDPNETEL